MRKISRKGIRAKLDKLVDNYVKERDNFTCQHCCKRVSGSDCHASHVIPVSAGLHWAYDVQNLKVLCFHCHINWWHKNPTEAGQWFRDKFPDRWSYLEAIKPIYNKHESIKDYQLVELYEKLKEIIDKQQAVA